MSTENNYSYFNGTSASTGHASTSSYVNFGGTSAAAPHVSGLAALMLSHHHPNNYFVNGLSPDDVEHIIQNNADDINGGLQNYPIGYDQWNGWGMIDAYSTLQEIEFPKYSVYHNNAPINNSQTTTSNLQITLMENIQGIPIGVYFADRVELISSYSNVFSPSTQIIDHWSRPSSSTGYSASNLITDNIWANYIFNINNNTANVTTTTYCWYVKSQLGSNKIINRWIPNPPNKLKTNYSLHLFDPNATFVELYAADAEINLYPVPSDQEIKVGGKLVTPENIIIQVHDVHGRLLFSRALGKVDRIEETLSVKELPSSIYFCSIIGEKSLIVKKFMKY